MSELSPEEIQDLEALADALDNGIYYDLFKVDDDATGTQIKRAFYDLSRRYHPDRFYRRQLGDYTLVIERVFTGITSAYETLRNPLDRSRYDREVVAKHRRRQKRREDHETIPATPAVGEKAPDHETKFNLPRGRRRSASSAEGSDPGETEEAPRGGEQAPPGEQPRKKRRRKKKSTGAARVLRDRLIDQLSRAKRYYEQGQADMESGQWVKAAGTLHLAVQFDPRNSDYRKLYEEAQLRAKQARSAQFIAVAENAESYRNIREAIANYEKAVACEPNEGLAYFRLAELQRAFEEEPRAALRNYRTAVAKEPDSVRYRMALGNMYIELKMKNNAVREFEAVLRLEPKHSEAKQGLKKAR